jgi:hypothetical protein
MPLQGLKEEGRREAVSYGKLIKRIESRKENQRTR